jgi:NitT/TauT family transport system permease protein
MKGYSKVTKPAWILILMAIWEISTRFKWVDSLLLPPLSKVIVELIQGILNGKMLFQGLQSIAMVVSGLVISVLVGILITYLDYFYPLIRGLLEVLASILHPLPGIALMPVIVLWAGVGMDAVLLIIVHAILWSFYLNLKMGFETIDKSLIEAARSNGASNYQLFVYVLVPESQHAFTTGLRIGWSRGWRGLIGAEMVFGAISSIGGIGWFMYERRAFGDLVGTYAGIVLVACIGVFVEQILFRHIKVND